MPILPDSLQAHFPASDPHCLIAFAGAQPAAWLAQLRLGHVRNQDFGAVVLRAVDQFRDSLALHLGIGQWSQQLLETVNGMRLSVHI